MIPTPAYAAPAAGEPLGPFTIERREPGAHDVLIDISHCGVCHSDLHQVRDEWGGATFPMVPGHEIVGRVAAIGSAVTNWKVGDVVGVGVFVDSCRECAACRDGLEQYCERGLTPTYNGVERDGKSRTFGGYSTRITVDEDYVLRVPTNLPPDRVAPLLCAGITTWSPLVHFGVQAKTRVAILGLGGLGHMGVKLAKARGAEVTVLSRTAEKRSAAKALGADDFVDLSDSAAVARVAARFDFLLDTVSAPHEYGPMLELLRRDATMVVVGLPGPSRFDPSALIEKRRRLAGSSIGGIRETQEMLDFCGAHGIGADVETIAAREVNTAFTRMLKSDVRYRFVIDCATLER